MYDPLEMDYVELDQAATCSGVSDRVELIHVTGDLGPLLSSLSCTQLTMYNMELDQPATSSLVWGLQHGVETLGLHRGVRLHSQTLLRYKGRGECGKMRCFHDTRDTYQQNMKTWAESVNWDISKGNGYILIKRK